MKSYLEIFIVSFESAERVRYARMAVDISEDKRNPDAVVQGLIKAHPGDVPVVIDNKYISHSTSWRYEHNGSIYLTYVVYSEHVDFHGARTKSLSLHDMDIPQTDSPERPRPDVIMEKHVLSHGMSHLCHLVKTSPDNTFAGILSPDSRILFFRMLPVLAGKI